MNDLPELDDDEMDLDDLDKAVSRWLNTAKTHDVISFSYVRRLKRDYQGWKPVSLAEYRLKLRGDQIALKKFREDVKRRARNERIAQTIENDNPFLGLI